MKPIFFKTPLLFRTWLEVNHEKEKELLVGYYKVKSNKLSLSWSDSVDQALCFGWIDGIRKSIDEESYCIRFTPRKPNSIWSNVNINKVAHLTKEGLMQKRGLEAFGKMNKDKAAIYSFENKNIMLSKEYEKLFRSNKEAWANFNSMAPSYQRSAIHWVMTAKRIETQEKRIEQLILDSVQNLKVKPFNNTYSK